MAIRLRIIKNISMILSQYITKPIIPIPDPGSRDQDVILASVGLLGKPKRGGSGIWNREGMGRG
jgi:hypothetical protein